MGVPVLIIGESGSGKSCSMRNLYRSRVGVFNVASKPLPFKSGLRTVNHAGYESIVRSLKANKLRCYVIDDSQYLMVFEEFARARESGYNKFTDMALHFYELVKTVIDDTTDDTIVYFLHHTRKEDDGTVRAKTVGRMIDDKLNLEGLFTIVLAAEHDKNGYWFRVRSEGADTIKAPMGMFGDNATDTKIDNDLQTVDYLIREYYGFAQQEPQEGDNTK